MRCFFRVAQIHIDSGPRSVSLAMSECWIGTRIDITKMTAGESPPHMFMGHAEAEAEAERVS